IEAGNGAEALEILESREVQLLLTDINMPVMTGVELLRQLAADPRWRRLTRVVISTDGSSSRRDEVSALDVLCYLEKPFSPEVMRDVLEEAARTARNGRRRREGRPPHPSRRQERLLRPRNVP